MTDSNFTPTNFEQNLISQEMVSAESNVISKPVMTFQTCFAGIMEMYSDEETVSKYLNDHQGWFIRCAEPMVATPFGQNGYTLTIGNYGAFGYHLEPQMSVILELPESKRYSMYSVPNPQFTNCSYEVDYVSNLDIESIPVSQAAKGIEKVYRKQGQKNLPNKITKINWTLKLLVKIEFPSFIYRLPMSVIKATGNRLLSQIVKQISPHLSYKVQKDFHTRFDLPIPPANSRICQPLNVKLG